MFWHIKEEKDTDVTTNINVFNFFSLLFFLKPIFFKFCNLVFFAKKKKHFDMDRVTQCCDLLRQPFGELQTVSDVVAHYFCQSVPLSQQLQAGTSATRQFCLYTSYQTLRNVFRLCAVLLELQSQPGALKKLHTCFLRLLGRETEIIFYNRTLLPQSANFATVQTLQQCTFALTRTRQKVLHNCYHRASFDILLHTACSATNVLEYITDKHVREVFIDNRWQLQLSHYSRQHLFTDKYTTTELKRSDVFTHATDDNIEHSAQVILYLHTQHSTSAQCRYCAIEFLE
jgi:hypothetical protein